MKTDARKGPTEALEEVGDVNSQRKEQQMGHEAGRFTSPRSWVPHRRERQLSPPEVTVVHIVHLRIRLHPRLSQG